MHPFSVDNYTKLKTKEYYVDSQDFPTTGDFVMINYISSGDSQIIDTPGMRELGMWDVSEGLCDAFADVEQFVGLPAPECLMVQELVPGGLEGIHGQVCYSDYQCLV